MGEVNILDAATLSNPHVRLELLQHKHEADLCSAVGDLWRTTWYMMIPGPDRMGEEIQRRLDLYEQGLMVPWAIIDPATDAAVGMTTYMNLNMENRRLEVGSTWLGPGAQGTKINPAAKLLLLQRAFEDFDCLAVELRAHWHNRQSRGAIEKLGAKQDGVLRNHVVMPNGTIRDTVVYSIIDAEWPTVKFALEHRLG